MKVELVQFVLSICVAGGFLHAWLLSCPALTVGRDSSVGIATRYELDGLGIESR